MDNIKKNVELSRVLSNPDSLIVSKELEGIIDLDSEAPPSACILVFSEKKYSVSILQMIRSADGVTISLGIDSFSPIDFLKDSTSKFIFDDKQFRADIISYSAEELETLTIFLRDT